MWVWVMVLTLVVVQQVSAEVDDSPSLVIRVQHHQREGLGPVLCKEHMTVR